VRRTDDDAVTLIGAGITLHEAVVAADQLAADGIKARVIDLYSVKPIDVETVRAAGRETGAIVTVEDHWPEGGIGDAVLDALAGEQPHPVVTKLAVRQMPGSGTPAELVAAAGIDANHIADAVRELAGRSGARGRSPTEVGSARRE
jgi:transketolase